MAELCAVQVFVLQTIGTVMESEIQQEGSEIREPSSSIIDLSY